MSKSQLNPYVFPDFQKQERAALVREIVMKLFLALLIVFTFLAGVASGILIRVVGG